MASMSDDREERTIQFNFELLFQIIVDRVDYQRLMAFLPPDMLTPVQRKEIFNLNKKVSPSAATRRILEIVKESKKAGKYQALVDALKRDYPKLAGALTGHSLPNDSVQQSLITVFSSYIMEKMDTRQVLPYLTQSNVIGQLEKEMVETELRNYGNMRGAQILLLHLHVHIENWYTEFLKALCDSNQTELAEFIDKSFTQKYTTTAEAGVMKTDADAQLYLSTKENRSDIYMDTAEVLEEKFLKELRIKEEKEADEAVEEERSLENIIDVYEPAYESLGDLGAAAPRFITPASHVADEDHYQTMSVLESNNLESSDLQAELDQIVSQQKPLINRKLELLHGENSSNDYVMSLDDPALAAGIDTNTSLHDHNGTMHQRHPPATNRSNFSGIRDSQNEDEEILLRKYQQELARPALQGKNVIIVAPTGSGKTRVACRIIQEHFQQMRKKLAIGKVILLVKDVALADQHGKTCQELLQKYRTESINGETKQKQGISLGDTLERRDILVVTAQLLLNSLMNGEIPSITQFSLIIFDECHHCHDEHAYNKIMQYYLDIKLRPGRNISSLPQIIGLTASVGVGKASNIQKAKEHIIKLMANLDAELISTVKENQEELQQYVAMPTSDAGTVYRPQTEAEEPDAIIRVRPRANDAFRVSITKVMNAIENRMRNAEVVKKITRPADYVSELNAPHDKGSEPYIQWLGNMLKATITVPDQEVQRFITPCHKHLKWYNDALIIYNDARVKDAVDYLHEKMDDWQKKPNMDVNEQCLLMLYRAGTQPKYTQEVNNPKLDELKRLILTSSGQESQCIVFVKTRALAKAVVSWMKDTPELNALSPTIFVGANAAKDKGGITRFQQGDKLAEFRRGRYKIMVATSVAEEGLDIQQCNLVLRYDHVTHEIAMVQARGRARAKDSRYHVVAQVGKGIAEKEEINMLRENLMQKAIIELQMDNQQNPQSVRTNIRELQEEDKLDRYALSKQKKDKQKKQTEHELRCIHCNEFICMSSDIRKILNAHNVVIDPTLQNRVSFTRNSVPTFQDDEIEFGGKIFCKCHEDFGQMCIYRHQEYPVIKIDKFVIVNEGGERQHCRKWKKVPFVVPQLTNEDRRKFLDSDDLE